MRAIALNLGFITTKVQEWSTEALNDQIDRLLDGHESSFSRLVYPVLGLLGEVGEVANKLKKVARDQAGEPTIAQEEALIDELGDVLWYQAEVAHALGESLGSVGEENLAKLASRQERGVIHGSGDNR